MRRRVQVQHHFPLELEVFRLRVANLRRTEMRGEELRIAIDSLDVCVAGDRPIAAPGRPVENRALLLPVYRTLSPQPCKGRERQPREVGTWVVEIDPEIHHRGRRS